MNKLLTATASIATVLGIGLGGYQIGKSSSSNDANDVKINIENSINNVISELPAEKKDSTKEIFNSLLELVSAASDTDDNEANINKATNKVKESLSSISLVSYEGSQSPFIPPMNKVQFLCANQFALAHVHTSSRNMNITLKIDGRSSGLSPGDIKTFRSNQHNLRITYLEYSQDKQGPILKYECE